MNLVITRYALLIGLLLTTVWWVKTGAIDSKAAFFIALASYIGTDVFQLNSKSKSNQHDSELFAKFLSTLPSSGSIEFIKNFNFAGFSFDTKRLIDLDRFLYEWNDAEHEFLDKKLEAKRKALFEENSAFLGLISVNTFPTKSSGWNTVPPEWEEDDPEHFHHVVGMIHNSATKVVELHQDLVRNCKAKLGTPVGA